MSYWDNKKNCLKALKNNGCNIKFMPQTNELCLKAIKMTPEALKYIKTPNLEQCKLFLDEKKPLIYGNLEAYLSKEFLSTKEGRKISLELKLQSV